MKKYTTIDEGVRAELGLTRDEYALIQYIEYRSADPRGNGACVDSKEDIADWVGVKRRGLYYMIDRLQDMGLLLVGIGRLRVSEKWVDIQAGVQKVHTECAKSAQAGVQKVHTECAKSAHTYIGIEREIDKKKERESVAAVESWIDELSNQELYRDQFSMTYKIPKTKFEEYLNAFKAHAKAQQLTRPYAGQHDLVKHFMAFSAKRFLSDPQHEQSGGVLPRETNPVYSKQSKP